MNYDEAQARAQVLKALAHPVRLILVDALRSGDRCACELQDLVRVDQSTLSRHLAQLREAGIVTEKRQGVRRVQHLAALCVLDAVECADRILKHRLRQQATALRLQLSSGRRS